MTYVAKSAREKRVKRGTQRPPYRERTSPEERGYARTSNYGRGSLHEYAYVDEITGLGTSERPGAHPPLSVSRPFPSKSHVYGSSLSSTTTAKKKDAGSNANKITPPPPPITLHARSAHLSTALGGFCLSCPPAPPSWATPPPPPSAGLPAVGKGPAGPPPGLCAPL